MIGLKKGGRVALAFAVAGIARGGTEGITTGVALRCLRSSFFDFQGTCCAGISGGSTIQQKDTLATMHNALRARGASALSSGGSDGESARMLGALHQRMHTLGAEQVPATAPPKHDQQVPATAPPKHDTGHSAKKNSGGMRMGELCWNIGGDTIPSLRPNPAPVLRGGYSGSSNWPPGFRRSLPGVARRGSLDEALHSRRRFFMSLVSSAGGLLLGAVKLLAVPYVSLLMLLYFSQRTIIYQAPRSLADPRSTGGKLVVLPASDELIQEAGPQFTCYSGTKVQILTQKADRN